MCKVKDKNMIFKKTILIILFLVYNAFSANVIINLWPLGLEECIDTLIGIANSEGHEISIDSVLTSIEPNAILYYFVFDTVTTSRINSIQRFVGQGGRCILIGEVGPSSWNHINTLLSDTDWDDSLGNIRCNYDCIRDSPADSVDGVAVEKFPNFGDYPRYFPYVDTIITRGPSSYSILAPDSGTAKPFIWGRKRSYSNLGAYDSFAVLGIIATYGRGELIVFGELIPSVIGFYDNTNWGDNHQFLRNLFTTNDRADSAWLSGTDSTFTVFLPNCTPFVAESTYFSFESGTHGLWELRASDWSHWHTDSSITIQYPDTCPMGETFEVCIKLVPDATGETVLPTGAICDSFTFNYSAIAETPIPQAFNISAYPNPFNSAVSFAIDGAGVCNTPLRVEIYDVAGRKIKTDVGEALVASRNVGSGVKEREGTSPAPTENAVVWHPAPSLGSGVYLIRIQQDGRTYTKPVVYVK